MTLFVPNAFLQKNAAAADKILLLTTNQIPAKSTVLLALGEIVLNVRIYYTAKLAKVDSVLHIKIQFAKKYKTVLIQIVVNVQTPQMDRVQHVKLVISSQMVAVLKTFASFNFVKNVQL